MNGEHKCKYYYKNYKEHKCKCYYKSINVNAIIRA